MHLLLFLLACKAPPADTGTPWWEERPTDADGDGFTAHGGDCDDGDASIHPDIQRDACGHGDEDCDGEVDEDGGSDAWESNDASAADLGAMADVDQILLWPTLFPASDVDRFTVTLVDPDQTWFSFEVWL